MNRAAQIFDEPRLVWIGHERQVDASWSERRSDLHELALKEGAVVCAEYTEPCEIQGFSECEARLTGDCRFIRVFYHRYGVPRVRQQPLAQCVRWYRRFAGLQASP